jgi:hypothetical protein
MLRPTFSRAPRGRAWRLIVAIASAASLACSGSPGDRPPLYPVKGRVLYKGKPIAGGVVVYEREDGGAKASAAGPGGGPLRATGRIEPDGGFRLTAFPGAEGVPEGRYKVGISSVPPRTEGGPLDAGATAKKGDPDVLRGRYADPSKSGLQAEVLKDGPNEPTFDLK